MKKLIPTFAIALLLATIIFNTGCKKDQNPENKIILHDNVVVISPDQNQDLILIDSNRLIYGQEIDFKAGDILVSDVSEMAPYGYLRKVISVSTIGNQYIVSTENAKLTDVIKEGKAQFTYTLSPDDTLRSSLFTGEFNLNAIEEVTASSGVEANLNGDYSLGLDLNVDFEINNSELEYAKFGIEPSISGSINAEITGLVQLPQDSFEKKLFSYPMNPITFWIGAVPIVFIPDIYAKVGVSGSAEGYVVISSDYNASNEYFAEYSNGAWDLGRNSSYTSSNHDISAGVSVNAETYIKIGLKAELYGSDDNYGKIEAKLSLGGEVSCSANTSGCPFCNYSLKASAKGKAEIALGLLGYDIASFSTSTPEIIFDIASGNLPEGCFVESNIDYSRSNILTIEMNGVFYSCGSPIKADSIPNSWNYRIPILVDNTEIASLSIQKVPGYVIVPTLIGGNNRLYLIYEEPDIDGNYGNTYKVKELNLSSNIWTSKQNTSLITLHNAWYSGIYIYAFANNGLHKYNTISDIWVNILSGNGFYYAQGSIDDDFLLCVSSEDFKAYKLNKNNYQLIPIGQEGAYREVYTQSGEIYKFDDQSVYKYQPNSNSWEHFFDHNIQLPTLPDYNFSRVKTFNDGKTYIFYEDFISYENHKVYQIIHN
jgi:hypothetical protein